MSYDRAVELAEKIQAAGVPATVDPRSAHAAVRARHPSGSYLRPWLWVHRRLAADGAGAGTGQRRRLQEAGRAGRRSVAGVVDVRTMTFQSYVLAADNPPHPAYRIEFEEALDGDS